MSIGMNNYGCRVYKPSAKVAEAILKASAVDVNYRIPTTECAKLIRLALKDEFPGIKFSVKSRKYSMGSSIDIAWTDGPVADYSSGSNLEAAVEVRTVKAIANFFSGSTFDGMTDMASTVETLIETGTPESPWAVVNFGVDYVFANRSFSEEALARVELELRRENRKRGTVLNGVEARYGAIPIRWADRRNTFAEWWLPPVKDLLRFEGNYDEALRVASHRYSFGTGNESEFSLTLEPALA